MIFSGWRFNPKHPSKDGVLDYYGDSLRFQNGFGAWMTMIYVCTVDTKNNRVVNLKLAPGHIAD